MFLSRLRWKMRGVSILGKESWLGFEDACYSGVSAGVRGGGVIRHTSTQAPICCHAAIQHASTLTYQVPRMLSN